MNSETYPSSRVVSTVYDVLNRPIGVSSGSTNYADSTNTSYASNDALSQLRLLNATGQIVATQSFVYDPVRQQPTSMTLKNGSGVQTLQVMYGYCGASCGSNNGNVMYAGLTNSVTGVSVTQKFSYDKVNRLTCADELQPQSLPPTGDCLVDGSPVWRQKYNYDQWGNRMVTADSYIPNAYATPTALTQYTNNQWQGTGATYFPSGNLKTLPMRTFTYDGENQLVGSTQPNTGAIWYAYDGAGRRVQKTVGSTVTTYAYDGSGQLAAESTNVASSGANTEYLIWDILGSTRAILDGTGAAKEWIDYLPFGEEIPNGVGQRGRGYSGGVYPGNPDIASQKFTGKERDAETGLDFFGARYMSSAQGRFTSPDPIQIISQKLLDPQQWNMYSYVRNNPLRLVDPTGMYTTDCAQDDKKCNKLIDKFEKARQKDLKSKNENVRNGAGAYGDRGDDNGVVVHVVTGQQMQQAIGVTANGAVVPAPGQDEDRVDVYINRDLGGSDLQRTVAHEGTHVGDDLPFINSFDPDTGKYNPALNITHGQTEFNAFTAGAGVKKYNYSNVQCGNGPCIFGPQDAAKINQFLHNSPTYGPVFNIPVFDPRRWPQQ